MKGFAMSNVFTLDDLNKAIEIKYAPFYFHAGDEKYVLRQVLRLTKSERDFVVAELKMLDSIDGEDPDEDLILSAIENVLSTVTDGGKGSKLIELLGHDMISVQMLMEMWIEATQPGEASSSPA
jgi:hypothetical protein